MKTIQSKVTYKVPHWPFCNVDRFDIDATPSKQLCRFCIKSKNGHHCLLYDKSLSANNGQVKKLDQCCRATAGFESAIEPPEVPTIQPRELMKHAIEAYSKTVNDLINQGYPRPVAEQAAKQHIIGG